MPAYPATLPPPTLPDYGLQPADPVARSSIEAGRRAARERFLVMPTRVPVRWIFTEAEFAVFEAWWRHVVLDGAAWFDIALANGQGITTVATQFAEDWRADALGGGDYSVAAVLHVRAMPTA